MNAKQRLMMLIGLGMVAGMSFGHEFAPLNPEFVAHVEAMNAGRHIFKTPDGHGLGHIPAPINLGAMPAAVKSGAVSAPVAYDLRDYGKVTPVKDQGQYGNCWAFGSFGSMESCLLTGEPRDFSENNLANFHGFDYGYGDGGNFWMSIAYLSRWSGPMNESDDPYSNGVNSPAFLPVQKHVQQFAVIPDRTSALDNEALKQIIMTSGGFYSAFFWDNACYNSDNAAFYYTGTNYSNHAITIVGWNDNFERAKFSQVAPGNGAWLIKNSWGTSFGQSGYFWISYYDSRIGSDNGLFYNAESTANYESSYQYDTLGMCTTCGYGDTVAYGANIFTSAYGGTITAVSFYLVAPGSSYEISVRTDVTAGQPASGTLATSKSGTLGYAGYFTVGLDSAVTVVAGQPFSVVVKFTTPDNNYPIPCEFAFAGYSSSATANAGESYISLDGSSWEACTYGDEYFNVCIKAFGTGGSNPIPAPDANAYAALVYANYGAYYTYYAYYYYYNYDYYGFLANAYYCAYNANFYAYYAYLYCTTYGTDYGLSEYACSYAYYAYLYAGYAYNYETRDELSYYGFLYEYYASYYSYLVAAGQ